MKKYLIYQLAIVYQQKIEKLDLSLSDVRYFRDAFKPFVQNGEQIEKDRKDIFEKGIEDEKKNEELKTLFTESIETGKLPIDIIERIEKADIKMSVHDLNILEEAMK